MSELWQSNFFSFSPEVSPIVTLQNLFFFPPLCFVAPTVQWKFSFAWTARKKVRNNDDNRNSIHLFSLTLIYIYIYSALARIKERFARENMFGDTYFFCFLKSLVLREEGWGRREEGEWVIKAKLRGLLSGCPMGEEEACILPSTALWYNAVVLISIAHGDSLPR